MCLFKTSKTEPPQKLCLDTSPLEWTVTDVVRFIRTTDCAPLARIFLDQVRNSDADASIFIWKCIILMVSDVTHLGQRLLNFFLHLTWGIFFVLFRKLMDKHCCCWTSLQCRSAWTWSWDQPSSFATTLRGSSWHFTSSLQHSWEWTWTRTHQICVLNPVKDAEIVQFDFSYTGYSIESHVTWKTMHIS